MFLQSSQGFAQLLVDRRLRLLLYWQGQTATHCVPGRSASAQVEVVEGVVLAQVHLFDDHSVVVPSEGCCNVSLTQCPTVQRVVRLRVGQRRDLLLLKVNVRAGTTVLCLLQDLPQLVLVVALFLVVAGWPESSAGSLVVRKQGLVAVWREQLVAGHCLRPGAESREASNVASLVAVIDA